MIYRKIRKISVDSHSSSPAFGNEVKQDMYDLFKIGAVDAEQVIEHLHPQGMDSMIESLQIKKVEQAKMMQQHPELLEKQAGKSKKK